MTTPAKGNHQAPGAPAWSPVMNEYVLDGSATLRAVSIAFEHFLTMAGEFLTAQPGAPVAGVALSIRCNSGFSATAPKRGLELQHASHDGRNAER
jgi:hypothetical protein